MSELRKGDRVSWNAGRTTAHGSVQRVLTRRTRVGRRTVAASKEDPRYLVLNEATGKTVMKNGTALTQEGTRRYPVIVVASGIGVALVAAIAAFLLLGSGDKKSLDEYAAEAHPALDETEGAMQKVYAGFAATLNGGDPVKYNIAKFRSHVRGFKRTLEGALAAEQKNYARSRTKVEEAQSTIASQRATLTGSGEDLDDDAAEAAEQAREHLDLATAFLADYATTIAYFEARLEIDRERIFAGDDESTGGGTIEDFRQDVVRDVAELKRIQERYEGLTPPPGLEALHKDLNALAAFDLARLGHLAGGLKDLPADGIISLTGGDDRRLADYRRVQGELSALELNQSIVDLRERSAQLAGLLADANQP